MPMTLAHPAAVLPLARLGLPLSALVIGSMVPDLPVFVRDWERYDFTHSLLGIVTFDLMAALVVLLVWDRFVRDAVVDLSPDLVRRRLPARERLSRTAWLLAPLATVTGSLTHVGWDLFTHPGRWGERNVAWLHEVHGPLAGHQWAQHVSGVVGLTLVVVCASLRILRSPLKPPRTPRSLPAWTLPLLLLAASAYALASGLSRFDEGVEALAFQGAVGGIVGLAVTALTGAAWWHLARRAAR